ncbi:MAG: immunoglobulin-like domain-containing protein, partial [Bacteroidota bacterium]
FNTTDGSGNQANTFRLVVKIDNTIFPTITLNGDDDMIVDVNSTWKTNDPGVSISSDYYAYSTLVFTQTTDPNMTKLGTYIITYCVTDPSNNQSCVSRTVHVVDRIAPIISLLGDNPYILWRYKAYVDPGITISDNYYTEVALMALKTVDFTKVKNDVPGIYYVAFNVTDPSGNIASQVRRTVIVKESTGISTVSSLEKIKIYPNPSNGKFTIDLENGSAIQTIKVYSIIGSLVKEISVSGTNKSIDIDMSGMNEGMYIVKVEGAGKTFTQKINIVK